MPVSKDAASEATAQPRRSFDTLKRRSEYRIGTMVPWPMPQASPTATSRNTEFPRGRMARPMAMNA